MMHPKASDAFCSFQSTSRYPHCRHFLFVVHQCIYVPFCLILLWSKSWWRLTFPSPEILLPKCLPILKGNTPQTNQYPMTNIHFGWWSNSRFQNQAIVVTKQNQKVSNRHLHNISQILQIMLTLRPSLILFHCPLPAIGPGWRSMKRHSSEGAW